MKPWLPLLRVEPSPTAHPVQTSFPGVSCSPALPTQAPGAAGWGTRRGACLPRGPCTGSSGRGPAALPMARGCPALQAGSFLPTHGLGRQWASLNLRFLFWNMAVLRTKRGPEVFQMGTSSAKSRLSAGTYTPVSPPGASPPSPRAPTSLRSSPGPAVLASAACGQAGRTLGQATQRAAALWLLASGGVHLAPPKKPQHPCPLTGKSGCRARGLCGQAHGEQVAEWGWVDLRQESLAFVLVWELALAESACRVESRAFPWSRAHGAWAGLAGAGTVSARQMG